MLFKDDDAWPLEVSGSSGWVEAAGLAGQQECAHGTVVTRGGAVLILSSLVQFPEA